MCWPVWLEELSLPVEQRPLLATVCYADAPSSSPSLELVPLVPLVGVLLIGQG